MNKTPPNAMTQREIVLDHLQRFGTITSWHAFVFYRITRLAEYIRQLRHNHNLPITDYWQKSDERRFKVYKLINRDELRGLRTVLKLKKTTA